MGIWAAIASLAAGIKGRLRYISEIVSILLAGIKGRLRCLSRNEIVSIHLAGIKGRLRCFSPNEIVSILLAGIKGRLRCLSRNEIVSILLAGIKGRLRCLSRNEIASILLLIIDAAASDPNNLKPNAHTIWNLVDHALAYGTISFTGGIPVYKTLRDYGPYLWSRFFGNDGENGERKAEE